MDPRVGHQVGLELGQVHIQCSVEAEGGCYRGNNLGNQTVEVGIGWPGWIENRIKDRCTDRTMLKFFRQIS